MFSLINHANTGSQKYSETLKTKQNLSSTMSTSFSPIEQPKDVVLQPSLEEELQKRADEAATTLYFVSLSIISASNLTNTGRSRLDKTDPYCEVSVGGICDRTETVKDDLNPLWNKEMTFFVGEKPQKIEFNLRDNNCIKKDDFMGHIAFSFDGMFERKGEYNGELPLFCKDGKKLAKSTLSFKVKCNIFKPVATEIKLEYLEKEVSLLKTHNTAVKSVFQKSESQRKELFEKYASISNELSESTADKEEMKKKLTEINQGLCQKIREFKIDNTKLEEKLSAKEEELSKTHEAKKDLDDRVETTEKTIHDQNIQIDTLTCELTAKEKAISEQRALMENKFKELEEMKTTLNNTGSEKQELEVKLAEAKQNLSEQMNLVESKSKELEEKNIVLSNSGAEKQELESKLAEVHQTLIQKDAEIEENNKKFEEAMHVEQKKLKSSMEKLEENDKIIRTLKLSIADSKKQKILFALLASTVTSIFMFKSRARVSR